MGIIEVILIVALVGLIVWLINTYASSFIDAKFIKIINIVAVVLTILWLVSLFFNWHDLNQIKLGR